MVSLQTMVTGDPGDVGGAFALDDGVGEALGVEGVVVEVLHGLGPPQAQGPHVLDASLDRKSVV